MNGRWIRPMLAAAGLVAVSALQPPALVAETLTVVTINVWSGLDYRGYLKMGQYEQKAVRKQRTGVLVEQLKALAPDLVALNEANRLPRYARRVARDLGLDRVWHVGLGGLRAGPVGLPVNLREGDVILARPQLQLHPAGRRQLSGGPVGNFFTAHLADATQVVAASIRAGGRTVYVFCTHWHASPFPTEAYRAELERRKADGRLDAKGYDKLLAEAVDGEKWRRGEAEKTLAFVQRVAAEEPAILLGDFNALPGSEEIALLRQAGFVDAFAAAGSGPGVTWDASHNPNIRLQQETYPEEIPEDPADKRIDYIFVRGAQLGVVRAEVVLNRPVNGLYASDHYGLLAQIEVR
jgi:endonuclease/exonuclease/phosphatase family metal-dependent hydrolase